MYRLWIGVPGEGGRGREHEEDEERRGGRSMRARRGGEVERLSVLVCEWERCM